MLPLVASVFNLWEIQIPTQSCPIPASRIERRREHKL
jgi:hypothetical protein